MGSDTYPLLILGTRTFAVEVADLAATIPGMQVAGFVENMDPQRCHQTLEGLPVYWIDDVASLVDSHRAVCALSTTLRSRFVEQAARKGLAFATLVHPAAIVSIGHRSSLIQFHGRFFELSPETPGLHRLAEAVTADGTQQKRRQARAAVNRS